MNRIQLFFACSMLALFAGAVQDPSEELVINYIKKNIAPSGSVFVQFTSHSPSSNGVNHYYGVQTHRGLPIQGTEFNAAIKDGEVILLNQRFILHPEGKEATTSFGISPSEAAQRVAEDAPIDASKLTTISFKEFHIVDSDLSEETIKIYSKWYFTGKYLRPLYEVSWYALDRQHWYNTGIDATTGEVVNQVDWVTHCNVHPGAPAHSHPQGPSTASHAEANQTNGTSSYNVFAWPLESPNHGNRSIEVDPFNEDASPYGWHDTNGSAGEEFSITRGNNAYAYEDRDGNNVVGTSPDGGASLEFSDTFSSNASAALFTDASITNLFYWNNLLHDVWWHYGFDEESGNFQQNNYGNGGNGGDYVRAEAQDGVGTNNANFATPVDGLNPRMQMFLWASNLTADYFKVNSPSGVAGKYNAKRANFGPSLSSAYITGDLVLVNDGVDVGKDGCTTISNTSEVNGKIAYIQRGTCSFVTKVKNAQDAGAIGVVIFNDRTSSVNVMGGTDNTITIPSVLIDKTIGDNLESQMGSSTVNVSLYDSTYFRDDIKDSDFDNGVISHEYGHGISIRLTGGAMNSSCLSGQEQMGEGWSDFFALVMTHESGDQGSDKRGIGTYVRNQGVNGNGIRPHPYSTNMSISPYTYDDAKVFSVPHGVGSVWCAMIWDLYWAMIDEYGYDSDIYTGTGGNNMAMQLVIDGLKLQPCNPGFVDGRDAILLADRLNNDGANQLLIWEVFSRRGLGYSADQGSSSSRSDGIEGYDVPPFLVDELVLSKSTDLTVQNDSPLVYTISTENFTEQTIYNISLMDTISASAELDEASLSCDHVYHETSQTLEFSLDSLEPGEKFSCTYTVRPKFGSSTEVFLKDSLETSIDDWRRSISRGFTPWEWSYQNPRSGDRSWYAAEPNFVTDVRLERSFDITTNNTVLEFYHWFETEAGFDGGVIEYKNSNGQWVDAGHLIDYNGYTSEFGEHDSVILSGRGAFTGSSNGYILTTMDLAQFANSTVDIRFRFTSDYGTAGSGWFIDDIALLSRNKLNNSVYARYDNQKLNVQTVQTFVYGEKVGNASIKTLNNSTLRFFPNPSTTTLTIQSDDKTKYSVSVVDVNGRTVYTGTMQETTTLDVQFWSAGVYFIELLNDNGERVTTKMIKQK